MSDLFKDIMSEQDKCKSKKISNPVSNDGDATTQVIPTSAKPGNNDNSGSSKKESREKRPSKNSTQESIDKLAQAMITGFHDLKNVVQGSVDNGDYGDDENE